jgi:PAS domain S-box-containing protein
VPARACGCCRRDGANRRSDFDHARRRQVRARQRCVCSRLGYSREQLARLDYVDLLERGFDSIGVHIASAIREKGIWRGTVVRKRRDGTTFPASCTVVGLRDPAGSITHYVDVERDTTDELKLRDQLVHSERLSAIGELVAGVAHEINNPLQTIVGSVELMMEERNTPSVQRTSKSCGGRRRERDRSSAICCRSCAVALRTGGRSI